MSEPRKLTRDEPVVTLAVLFVLAELADLATYLQAPVLESNPAMQGWPPTVVAAKFIALTAVAALALIGLTGRKQTFTLGVCLAIAAFSFGSNHAILTVVDALEAPRPATQPAPVSTGTTGNEQGTQAPAAEPRTPAPPGSGMVPPMLPVVASFRDVAPRGSLRSRPVPAPAGRASWYPAAGSVAAAGPALRRALGRHWRGTWVRVTAGGRSVAVRLSDWCQCYQGQASERIIDLSDDDFAVLAPLSAGVVGVRVTGLVLPATDTVPRGMP